MNTEEWNLRNGSSGCVRKKNVSTYQSGEGFVKVARVKVPETSKARVDKRESMSLKGCEEKCLRDCSCVAYTSANEVKESGCLTWHSDMEDIRAFNNGGQDLYVRVDAHELGKYGRKNHPGSLSKKGVVALVVISILLIMFLAISFVYWLIKNKNNKAKRMQKEYLFDGENNSDVTLFDLKDIVEATNNFSDTNRLAKGGFGSVYKGLLKDGMEIAVKRL